MRSKPASLDLLKTSTLSRQLLKPTYYRALRAEDSLKPKAGTKLQEATSAHCCCLALKKPLRKMRGKTPSKKPTALHVTAFKELLLTAFALGLGFLVAVFSCFFPPPLQIYNLNGKRMEPIDLLSLRYASPQP